MSNLKDSEINFVHLVANKLLKRSSNLVEKYYFIAELLIVEYR